MDFAPAELVSVTYLELYVDRKCETEQIVKQYPTHDYEIYHHHDNFFESAMLCAMYLTKKPFQQTSWINSEKMSGQEYVDIIRYKHLPSSVFIRVTDLTRSVC